MYTWSVILEKRKKKMKNKGNSCETKIWGMEVGDFCASGHFRILKLRILRIWMFNAQNPSELCIFDSKIRDREREREREREKKERGIFDKSRIIEQNDRRIFSRRRNPAWTEISFLCPLNFQIYEISKSKQLPSKVFLILQEGFWNLCTLTPWLFGLLEIPNLPRAERFSVACWSKSIRYSRLCFPEPPSLVNFLDLEF